MGELNRLTEFCFSRSVASRLFSSSASNSYGVHRYQCRGYFRVLSYDLVLLETASGSSDTLCAS